MIPSVKITELDIGMVKDYLRVDHDDDDVFISTILAATKSFIQSYLNMKFDEFDEIPDEFTIAALALSSHWYEKREIQREKQGKELNYIFAGILDLHRNWN